MAKEFLRTLVLFLLENTLEFCGEISGTSGCGFPHGGLITASPRLEWLELGGKGHQAREDWHITSTT